MAVITNNHREQMQAQMTICLNKMREKVASEMIDKIDTMQKRPRIKGADDLPTITSDSRLSRNEDGMTAAGMAMGVPGLSGLAETAVDVGSELYGSRKATFKRPQDDEPLSFREIAEISEKNRIDMDEFGELSRQLDTIDVYLESGYKNAAMFQGSLLPIEDNGPDFKYQPTEEVEPTANLNFAPKHNPNKPRWAG